MTTAPIPPNTGLSTGGNISGGSVIPGAMVTGNNNMNVVPSPAVVGVDMMKSANASSVNTNTGSTKSTTKKTTKKKKSRAAAGSKKKNSSNNSNSNSNVGGNNGNNRNSPVPTIKSVAALQLARNELTQIQQHKYDVLMDHVWTDKQKQQQPRQPKNMSGGYLPYEHDILHKALKNVGLTAPSNALGDTCDGTTTEAAYFILMERARRYALELLVDAQEYAQHCNLNNSGIVESRDLELAAEYAMQDDGNCNSAFAQDFAHHAQYAEESVNRIPLPLIPSTCYNGVSITTSVNDVDNDHWTLARTYDVVSAARVSQMNPSLNRRLNSNQNSANHPSSQTNANNSPVINNNNNNNNNSDKNNSAMNNNNGNNNKPKSSTTSSYGATKGRQIPINFKSDQGTSNATPNTTITSPLPQTESSVTTTATKTGTNKRKLGGIDLS